MTKGRTLSYWEDVIPKDGKQVAFFIRDKIDGPWLLVGLYEASHLKDVLNTSYANWPKTSILKVSLP